MIDDFNSLVKGAFIHDVGKLIQRSEQHPFDRTHGQWGYEWLVANKFFENDFAVNAPIMHHKNDKEVFQSNYGLIWYEADNLASSERKQEEGKEKGRWDMFTPLASPFFMVRNPNTLAESLTEIPYLQLRRTTGIDSVSFKKPDITVETYKAIRDELEKDLKIAAQYKPYSINLLLMLFEKHLSNIPSITLEILKEQKEELQKHPDISLFNHSKLTAAIAGCMYHFYKETYAEKWLNNELLKEEILNPSVDTKPYLLIGGDISGVQKFIYTITSKGVLKSLKGRSFYIELLTEHAISELINALKLSRCNIIFSGGGHFYILSHNTKTAIDSILNVKTKIDDFLFDEFKGSLKINLARVPFGTEGFKNAVPVWRDLSNNLELLKKKKWESKLHDVLRVEGQHDECLTESCEVCFREDLPLVELARVDDKIKVCKPCYDQYKLGSDLSAIAKSDYPVIYKMSEKPDGDFIKIGDWYYQIKKGWDEALHKGADVVYRVNDFNAKHYSHDNSVYTPIGIYQHEDISELSDAVSLYGMNRIAVLRMDVDNLGKIFSFAVPEEDRTFSRMASISNGLNQFYKYHLNDIVGGKAIEPCDIADRGIKSSGRKLSVVYSGGDDLFIIGHWLDILESAYDIKRYFKQYTGNKFITISGGIAMGREHYPVYQFARDAAELEEIAKSGGKDALTIFADKRFEWALFERVIDRIRLFKKFSKPEKDYLGIDEQKLPKTFFYRLLALARRFNEDGSLILPKAAYLISRARFKESNPDDILRLKEVMMNGNKNEWHITETATLITLMLMRKGGREDA